MLYRVNTTPLTERLQIVPQFPTLPAQPCAWPVSDPSTHTSAGRMHALSQHCATRWENEDTVQLSPLLPWQMVLCAASPAVSHRQKSSSCVLVRPKVRVFLPKAAICHPQSATSMQ